MKTLEMNNYGVQEMNMNEMKEVDGGWPTWIEIVAFIMAVGIAIYTAITL